MKMLRNILKISLLLASITGIIACSTRSAQQVTTEGEEEAHDSKAMPAYWFFLRVKTIKAKKAYEIIGTGSRLTTGTLAEFDKALWWGTTRGQLAIGPFFEEREAEDARLLYRKSRSRLNALNITEKDEVFWFLVSFRRRQRSSAYKMVKQPSQISSGSTQEFLDALYEGLGFEHITVGPFWDGSQAEEAQKLYQKNE